MISTTTLHPMIVHFPIALLITGFLFASLDLFIKKCSCTPCVAKISFWLLGLGAISALAAVLSGALFTTMQSSPFFPDHQMMAFTTAIVACLTALIYAYYIYKAPKNKTLRVVGYLAYVVTAILVSITGHYGGLIVY